MVDEAGDFMSLMGSTLGSPVPSGGRGFFLRSARHLPWNGHSKLARLLLLVVWKPPEPLSPAPAGLFSCKPLGTLGDGLTWGYTYLCVVIVLLAPASRRGFSCGNTDARPMCDTP